MGEGFRYIEATRAYAFTGLPDPAIFLAGGITGCPDWQSQVKHMLADRSSGYFDDYTLFNPRRAVFPMDDPTAAEEQIMWEYQALRDADIVLFWFCKETVQPIVLLELGATMERLRLERMLPEENSYRQAILIGVEEGYSRKQDVFLQSACALGYDRRIYDSLESLVNGLKREIYRHHHPEKL